MSGVNACRGNRVLVVDDNPDSLKFLTETLEAEGIMVLIAMSGEAAIDLLEHVIPDLILMDAVMPGMDGFEATRTIKRHPAAASIPIIFMTGMTDSGSVVQALAAGGVDHVRKPIIVEELMARVRVHIANARKAQDSQLGLDATRRTLLALRGDGSIVWCTPGAARQLAAVDPGWSEHSGMLPECLRAGAGKLVNDGILPGALLRIEAGDDAIELALVDRPRTGEALVRISLIDPRTDVSRLQRKFGLTLREAEVLLWISYGKTNRVIGETLSISPRTVNKHLEQIFRKLGVETRAAAAAFAVRTIAG